MRMLFSSSPESMLGTFAEEFIELDGIEGLLFVVGRRGEQLRLRFEEWEDDYLLSVTADKCGREVTELALQNAAETDQNARAYLRAVEENRAKRENTGNNKRADPNELTYDHIRMLIDTEKAGGILVHWSQTATEFDLERAARDLDQETDLKKPRSYLLLFRERPFPLE
jgi:hypothetical protein